MDRIARLFERHRFRASLGVVLVTILAVFGASQIEIDDVPSTIFRSDDEDYERLESVFRDFGSDDNDCLVVLEAEEFFEPGAAELIRELAHQLGSIAGVDRVLSLADVFVFADGPVPAPRPLLPPADAPPGEWEAARARAHAHPLVGGKLYSTDGRTLIAVARLEGTNLPIGEMRPRVEALREAVADVTRDTAVRARVTGIPPLRVVIFDEIAREQRLFAPLGALLGFLVGLVVFRRPGPVLITSGASVLAGFWAFGALGLAGESINLLNTEMPLLIMVIAFTDAAHLMIDILRQRREGVPALRASAESIRHLGLPCLLTSFTTAVGFGSLGVSRVDAIARFGVLFAGAVALTFVAVLTIVPLASSFVLRAEAAEHRSTLRFSGLRRPSEALIRWVVRHAKVVASCGIALTVALLLVSLRLVPDNRLTETVPHGHEAVAALQHCERAFGGMLMTAVLCEWSDRIPSDSREVFEVIGEAQAALVENRYTSAPSSVLDLLALLPGEGAPADRAALLGVLPSEIVGRFYRPTLSRALVSARIPDGGSRDANPAYEDLEVALDRIRAEHPEFSLAVTGTGYVARRNINLMIEDFAFGLGVAAIVIFAALTVAFRSLRLGAISILPNAFPLAVAAAVLAVSGIELQIVAVLAFTIGLGVAVDDTIHFLSRFRRELERTKDVGEACVAAFIGVGRALAVTTATLLAGFGVMFLSAVPTSELFAQIACIELLAALVGDLLLLPALLVVFVKPTR